MSAKSVMDMAGNRILYRALPKTFRLSSTDEGSKSGFLRRHSAFAQLTAAENTTVSLQFKDSRARIDNKVSKSMSVKASELKASSA